MNGPAVKTQPCNACEAEIPLWDVLCGECIQTCPRQIRKRLARADDRNTKAKGKAYCAAYRDALKHLGVLK